MFTENNQQEFRPSREAIEYGALENLQRRFKRHRAAQKEPILYSVELDVLSKNKPQVLESLYDTSIMSAGYRKESLDRQALDDSEQFSPNRFYAGALCALYVSQQTMNSGFGEHLTANTFEYGAINKRNSTTCQRLINLASMEGLRTLPTPHTTLLHSLHEDIFPTEDENGPASTVSTVSFRRGYGYVMRERLIYSDYAES